MLAAFALGLAPAAAADDNFFTHLHTDKAMANVTVSPARKGPVEIAIQLETVEEKPLAAKAVIGDADQCAEQSQAEAS